jgi:cyclophilin family peptidyl-prolyl cis-trans isomerase
MTKIQLYLRSVILLLLITFAVTNSAVSAAQLKLLPNKGNNMEQTASHNPTVLITTNKGDIKIEVFQKEAPISGGNFVDLVQRGFYNGLKFHRYEPGFVIQGGDPKGNGSGGFIDPSTKQERTIPLEIIPGLRHNCAGMVAMARTQDPNSASSQFYITLAPASFLDDQYAVFGKVTEGLNVVQQLRAGDKMEKVEIVQPAN